MLLSNTVLTYMRSAIAALLHSSNSRWLSVFGHGSDCIDLSIVEADDKDVDDES